MGEVVAAKWFGIMAFERVWNVDSTIVREFYRCCGNYLLFRKELDLIILEIEFFDSFYFVARLISIL